MCIDSDPTVTAHLGALHRSIGAGTSECAQGDLRRPDRILACPELARTIDVTRPVAVGLLTVLHVVDDHEQTRRIVNEPMRPFPSGSALAVSLLCRDEAPGEAAALERIGSRPGIPLRYASRREVADLVSDLQVEQPGIVPVHLWRSGVSDHASRSHRTIITGGLAIKS